MAACLARSAAQCTALGCDGVKTIYWWACNPLTKSTVGPNATGTTALEIRNGDASFGATTSNSNATAGLSTAEQSALQSRSIVGTALPDILTVAAFKARFSPVQLSAIAASKDSAVTTKWNALGAAALVDLEDQGVQAMLAAMLTDNLITSANYNTITALTATVANP